MSKQFKPLFEQLAEKLSAELRAGTSPLQKPIKENGMPAFVTPINPITGKGYSALNTIALALKGHDDPRWMSAEAARYAGNYVKEDAKGTLINFPKTSDIQAIRTPDGAKVVGEDGKTQTRTVEFAKPEKGVAFLFNAEQIKDFPPLEDFLKKQQEAQPLTPIERAEKLIADSKAVIVHGGQEAFYDKAKDEIHLPEKDQFENETKYLQAAIHQLAHWTGHESRQKRPMEGRFGSQEYGREEFRAAIASMLIGGELKIGHNFGPHAAYATNWAKTLKDDPYELSKAAYDAQRIASMLLGVGKKKEIKEGAGVEVGFKKGDQIAYSDTTYKVLETYKNKNIKVEDANGGRINVKPTDVLYKSLLEAKANPMEPEMVISEEQEQEQGQTNKIGR
ncbi:ArdC family protein [Mucilaginibacter polytrichastri]|uniref:Antirestriction protein ArdC n=1 Tax=Mucilaginibacter polytrichastri TaxID=1302689 RepID=A0A1Q5ZY34_9SPHI|nr:zincin-like metallopeptidase domain-containing protein [Mucilaginibacter polytrichastri]OKS86673.1 hypothetical protein RG47T_2130 [Mucilaginibacter polytrichastri]SFS81991.1 Antirestriction protein ArdC [Mucilaginibacter polytrichastri]